MALACLNVVWMDLPPFQASVTFEMVQMVSWAEGSLYFS